MLKSELKQIIRECIEELEIDEVEYFTKPPMVGKAPGNKPMAHKKKSLKGVLTKIKRKLKLEDVEFYDLDEGGPSRRKKSAMRTKHGAMKDITNTPGLPGGPLGGDDDPIDTDNMSDKEFETHINKEIPKSTHKKITTRNRGFTTKVSPERIIQAKPAGQTGIRIDQMKTSRVAGTRAHGRHLEKSGTNTFPHPSRKIEMRKKRVANSTSGTNTPARKLDASSSEFQNMRVKNRDQNKNR